jgi:hypothetical protein
LLSARVVQLRAHLRPSRSEERRTAGMSASPALMCLCGY